MSVWEEKLRNARRLMEERDIDILIISRPEHVFYLSGVTDPTLHACGTVVLPLDGEPKLVVMWLDTEVARRQSQLQSVVGFVGGSTEKWLKVGEIVRELGVPKATVAVDDINLSHLELLRKSVDSPPSNGAFVNASNMLDELGLVKSDEEVRLLRKAAEIADRGMKAAVNSLRIGATEIEVAAEAEYEMAKCGSRQLSSLYGFHGHRTMVASGGRTLLVHPFASGKKIEKNDLVIIDLGAVYQGYCSDICRTCVVGSPTEAQRDGFEAVLKAQDAGFSALKEGVKIQKVDDAVRSVLRRTGYLRYFTYLVGHSIGLRCEENPSIMLNSDDVELKSNMVFSLLESPVFIPRAGGIRLEDVALVKEAGSEALTRYPRELVKV